MTTATSTNTATVPPPPPPPSPSKVAADATLRKVRGSNSTHVAELPSLMWVEVTPAMAEHWLRSNVQNRRIRRPQVDAYRRTMLSPEGWTWNPAPISFGTDDKLLDGQHRLTAIAESGRAVTVVVATDVPDKAQETMDTGMRRTLGDALNLRSEEYKFANHVAAAAKMTFDLQSGTNKISARPSQQELLDVVDNDPILRWVANERVGDLPTIASKTVMIYCFSTLYKVDREACEEFFQRLKSLADLPADSPILALHKRMAGIKRTSTSHRDRVESVVAIFMAWNAWRRGESRRHIKITPGKDKVLTIPKPV